MGIIITILALGFVVFFHELGHLLMAKRAGVGVYEFSVGMGPKLIGRTYKNTLYSIRILPFGGFVKLAGLDEGECSDEENFYKKSIKDRALTIAAGSIMNLILGFIVFVLMFSIFGVPKITSTVDQVLADGPAAVAGLISGDSIHSVDGIVVEDIQKDFIPVVNNSKDKTIVITVVRDSVKLDLSIVPTIINNGAKAQIGIVFSSVTQKFAPHKAIALGFQSTYENVVMVFKSLGMLFSGDASLKQMAGPIGIVQLASFSLERGFFQFLNIIAMISISLGVINLFPFPVLDGGHLVLLGVEAIRKKPMAKKWENLFNNVGAALLIVLMATVVINDLVNWQDRVHLMKKLEQKK